VVRLRGTVHVEHSLARRGAERLWQLLESGEPVRALGALTGNQAVEMVSAGLQAIYLSGWQVAADANTAGQMYPDQSLYPADSVPAVVRRINHALQRADQIAHVEGRDGTWWMAPIVADAEAGFGGDLNAYELMKGMVEAGAAAVHFEDQLASAKKCGHLGGKVLVPTREFVQKLVAARLAADVLDVPTLLVARTDAQSATLLTSDIDPRDRGFLTGERTVEGFYHIRNGLEMAIERGLAFAPWADLVWCETSTPDLAEAKRFADGIHAQFPGKRLAYNCSPSFNWSKKLDAATIAKFQRELGAMGYAFQFVTLAGLPCPEPEHVRAVTGLSGQRHGRVLEAPGPRVRARRLAGLHRDQAPVVRGHGLVRRAAGGDLRRGVRDPGARALDREAAVLAAGDRAACTVAPARRPPTGLASGRYEFRG
jgi:isocitrate lyase